MTLRIEKVSDGQVVILRLSGRLQSDHVDQLKAQIEGSTQRIILDLEEVKLVDREVVCFLGLCEANGNVLPTFGTGLTGRERAGVSGDSSGLA